MELDDKFDFGNQKVSATMVRNRGLEDKTPLKGKFKVEIVRKNGITEEIDFENAVTNEGKILLFNIMFFTTTKISTWYIGMINGDGTFSTTAVTDTMSSHAGWTEFGTTTGAGNGYAETVRQTWVTIAAASQAITNTTAATFNIDLTGTLRGVFISTIATKGTTTGTLWSTALFTSALSVSSGDQIKITYTVSA